MKGRLLRVRLVDVAVARAPDSKMHIYSWANTETLRPATLTCVLCSSIWAVVVYVLIAVVPAAVYIQSALHCVTNSRANICAASWRLFVCAHVSGSERKSTQRQVAYGGGRGTFFTLCICNISLKIRIYSNDILQNRRIRYYNCTEEKSLHTRISLYLLSLSEFSLSILFL